jgi:hypothetical protein
MPELPLEFWIGTVVALVALVLGLAVTLAMDAKTKGEIRFIACCFLACGAITSYGIGAWQMSVTWIRGPRMFAAYGLFALVAVFTGEAIRWAHGRHLRAIGNEARSSSGNLVEPSKGDSLPSENPKIPSASPKDLPPPVATHGTIDTATGIAAHHGASDAVKVKIEHRPEAAKAKPDIGAFFIAGTSPGLVLTNLSDEVVVRDPGSTISAWNLDTKINLPTFSSTETGRFIKKQGPAILVATLDNPTMRSLIKTGDRVLAIVTVDCPDCAKAKSYWLFVVYGGESWYSPIRTLSVDQSFIVVNCVGGIHVFATPNQWAREAV